MRPHYYNEFDEYAAAWLRILIAEKLIPHGEVDERDIAEVRPSDLVGYDSCHFFAGVSGWPLAARLAGWPDERPLWTASCPCQPFSTAGKGEGAADERNLWPDFFRLLRERRPVACVGEQVPNAIGHGWLDGISLDLEEEAYTVGSIVLPAAWVGAPILRHRLFWLAESDGHGRAGDFGRERAGNEPVAPNRRPDDVRRLAPPHGAEREGRPATDEATGLLHAPNGRRPDAVAESNGVQRKRGSKPAGRVPVLEHGGSPDPVERPASAGRGERVAGTTRRKSGVRRAVGAPEPAGDAQGVTGCEGPQGQRGHGAHGHEPGWFGSEPPRSLAATSAWADFRIVHCLDETRRRCSDQPGDEPLAYGIPRGMGPLKSALVGMGLDPAASKRVRRAVGRILAKARRNRVGRLCAYGNAIVPQVSALFLRAVMMQES